MLKCTIPPSVRPVKPDDLKKHLRRDEDDELDQITDCLDTAIELLDGQGELGRAMIRQTWELTLSGARAGCPIWLGMGDVLNIKSIMYRDASGVERAAEISDFNLYSDNDAPYLIAKALPNMGSFPDALKITFDAGYGDDASDVPKKLRQAIKVLATHYFLHRELVVIGPNVTRIPDSVDRLISGCKVFWK